MQRKLELDQSPALATVLRYFLATPLFALLAGLLFIWQGEAALQSRWSPVTLALTHLLTLGVLGMSMTGALIQILPVVAGCAPPRVDSMARKVHFLLAAGALTLAGAFLASQAWMFGLAVALLAPALLWFIASVAIGMWHMVPDGAAPMAATIRLALAALLVTVVLGALLGMQFARPGSVGLPLMRLTDVHAMWGLFGWCGLLLAGVAFQVLPMFQVTPLYDGRLERYLGLAVVLALVLNSVADDLASAVVLSLAAALFAAATLRLLGRRTREPDAMTLFWRLAMVCLLAAVCLWAAPSDTAGAGQPLAPWVLVIAGFVYSAINGMLYKIVPFLLWQHRQSHPTPGQRVLPVKFIIPDAVARRQFYLHAAAVLLLVAACWFPESLARAAGVALAVSALSLGWNLVKARRQGAAAA